MSPRITGPGGPHEYGGVIVDTRDAVILDEQMVATADDSTQGPIIAVELMGRVNRSTERREQLYLMNGDGAAAIVSEIIGLMGRCANGGSEPHVRLAADFRVALDERMKEMP